MKLDFSGLIDYITKDGAMYFGLSEAEFSQENFEELQTYYDMFQKYLEDNQYIEIPADASYDEVLSLLANWNPENMLADIREIMKRPLFEVDEMQGSLYILIPTKYACDTGKMLTRRFDPIF